MSYDEGRWRILPFDPEEPLGVPVLEVSASPEERMAGGAGYVLAHAPAIDQGPGHTRFLTLGHAGEDGIDLGLSEHRSLAARVGFRFREPLEPDTVRFRSVARCETAILVDGRGWLGCQLRREGICLGWSTEPRWEWVIECLDASACDEAVVTAADLRLWNHEAEDFLVFDTGESGPSLRWLSDYQRLQRIAMGGCPSEERLTGAGV